MPDTDQCVLGVENKTRIENIEEDIHEIKSDIKKLANDYSHRPTWFVSLIISALLTTVSLMAMWIITQK